MLKTFDFILIGVMTATATVTYSIKHRAELKLEEVKRLESEIKLEKDTIDLLRADWALLTQPNRLEKLIKTYDGELKLAPTDPTQLVQPIELPMLRDELRKVSNPPGEMIDGGDQGRVVAMLKALKDKKKINYNGVAGPCDFDKNGDVITPVNIWKYGGGQIETVKMVAAKDIPAG